MGSKDLCIALYALFGRSQLKICITEGAIMVYSRSIAHKNRVPN